MSKHRLNVSSPHDYSTNPDSVILVDKNIQLGESGYPRAQGSPQGACRASFGIPRACRSADTRAGRREVRSEGERSLSPMEGRTGVEVARGLLVTRGAQDAEKCAGRDEAILVAGGAACGTARQETCAAGEVQEERGAQGEEDGTCRLGRLHGWAGGAGDCAARKGARPEGTTRCLGRGEVARADAAWRLHVSGKQIRRFATTDRRCLRACGRSDLYSQ